MEDVQIAPVKNQSLHPDSSTAAILAKDSASPARSVAAPNRLFRDSLYCSPHCLLQAESTTSTRFNPPFHPPAIFRSDRLLTDSGVFSGFGRDADTCLQRVRELRFEDRLKRAQRLRP